MKTLCLVGLFAVGCASSPPKSPPIQEPVVVEVVETRSLEDEGKEIEKRTKAFNSELQKILNQGEVLREQARIVPQPRVLTTTGQ